MKIITDYIRPGMRNRPMTNPASSLYKKTMQAKYITIHEAWSTMDAKALHAYVKSQRAADRPASWHFSIDEKECYQALPLTESGWHAGDNLGPGNTTTIGIEICDYGMRRNNNWNLFWQAVDHCAKLCAHIINNSDTLLPFPECLVPYHGTLKQHYNWSGKNCPALIRAGGGAGSHWQKFVDLVGEYLKKVPETITESSYRWLLISGSYTRLVNAQDQADKLTAAGYKPRLMEIEINGIKYYRVVVHEHNEKGIISLWADNLKKQGFSAILIDQRPAEVVIPDDDELIEGIDPDIDRDWIDEHKEEFEEKDPYQDVSGILVLLRQLYEMLKKLFG